MNLFIKQENSSSTILLDKSYKDLIIKLLWFILILLFVTKQYFLTPYIPFGDDLPTIYNFLLKYNEANSLYSKLIVILNNKIVEHRLFSLSAITVLVYSIFEKVHLPIINVCGSIAWLGTSYIYYNLIKKSELNLVWLLPTLLILLSWAPYQVILWPMACLQHLIVITLAFLTIYLLSFCSNLYNRQFTNSHFYVAILFASIATYSSGNGLLIWPTGIILLVLQRERNKLIIWSISSVAFIGLYFKNLSFEESPSLRALKNISTIIGKELVGFFAGLGNSIHSPDHVVFLLDNDLSFSLLNPSIYLGIGIFIIATILFLKFIKDKDRTKLTITGNFFYIFLSILVVVLGRTGQNGDFVAFKSRYYIYSAAALANTIIAVAMLSKSLNFHKYLLKPVLLISFLFWYSWDILSFHKIINHHNSLQIGHFNWQFNKQWIIYQQTSFYEHYFNRFFKTVEMTSSNLTLPPSLVNNAFKNKKWDNQYFTKLENVNFFKDKLNKKVRIGMDNNKALSVQRIDEGYAVVMASDRDTIMLWSQITPNSLKGFLKSGEICRKGYKVDVELNTTEIPSGTYSFYQLYYSRNRSIISPDSEGTLFL